MFGALGMMYMNSCCYFLESLQTRHHLDCSASCRLAVKVAGTLRLASHCLYLQHRPGYLPRQAALHADEMIANTATFTVEKTSNRIELQDTLILHRNAPAPRPEAINPALTAPPGNPAGAGPRTSADQVS